MDRKIGSEEPTLMIVSIFLDDLYSESEKYFDYRDQLSQITAKTLVIVGDKDWICPPGRFS